MSQLVITVVSSQDVGDLSFSNWGKGRVSRELAKLIEGLGLGAFTGALDVQSNPAYGCGVLTLASGTGSVGATISGINGNVTWATSDVVTCDSIATAVNGSSSMSAIVNASSRTATGTITISSGSGVITATFAVPGQAPVTASVTWASSDANTAAALKNAINLLVGSPVIASVSSNVITVFSTLAGSGTTNTAGNSTSLAVTGTGATASGTSLSGGGANANVLYKAIVPGTIGSGITLAASGTGAAVPTGSNLLGGMGGPGNAFIC